MQYLVFLETDAIKNITVKNNVELLLKQEITFDQLIELMPEPIPTKQMKKVHREYTEKEKQVLKRRQAMEACGALIAKRGSAIQVENIY